MYGAYFWLKKRLSTIPNHRISGTILLEVFYRALNISPRAKENTITRIAFMCLHWKVASEVREAESGAGAYSIRALDDHRGVDQSIVKKISYLGIDIRLQTKKLIIVNYEKVNAVGA